MGAESIGTYRFGDLLALARQSWIRQMAAELAQRGFPGYRPADAATMRLLLRAPVPVGRLAGVLGVSRQAARKVAAQLEQRGYATTAADPHDRRRVNVVLTDAGRGYAEAVAAAVSLLNGTLEERVAPEALAAADAVLRCVLGDDPEMTRLAERVPRPESSERSDAGT